MTVFIGADWDQEKCVVAYVRNGKKHFGQVKRNPESVQKFVEPFQGDDVVVGIETGDPLWAALWRRAKATVYIFDAKKALRYSESLNSSGASDDRRAARALVNMVQNPAHQKMANEELSPEIQNIHARLATHDSLTQDIVRYSNRLSAMILQWHPALQVLSSSFSTNWFLNALEKAPTAAAWNELSPDEQNQALKGASQKRRKEIIAAFGNDYGTLDPCQETVVRDSIRATVRILTVFRNEKEKIDEALKNETAKHSSHSVLGSIPGIGPVIEAGLVIALSMQQEQEQEEEEKEKEKEKEKKRGRDAPAMKLGAAPVTRRSGTLGDRAPLVAMRRNISSLMQKIGHYLGSQLVRYHTWAKAAFAHYKKKTKSAFSSYRRIARSFLRVIKALLRNNTPFDEEKYINRLKNAGVEWAMPLQLEEKKALISAPT